MNSDQAERLNADCRAREVALAQLSDKITVDQERVKVRDAELTAREQASTAQHLRARSKASKGYLVKMHR